MAMTQYSRGQILALSIGNDESVLFAHSNVNQGRVTVVDSDDTTAAAVLRAVATGDVKNLNLSNERIHDVLLKLAQVLDA